MFLVVFYHIISPPPRLPGLAYLIAQSRKKSWDIEFQKILLGVGRYAFGSEISYNKAPPRLPGLGCLNKPKSQKIVGH